MTTLALSKPQPNTEVDAAALSANFLATEEAFNGGIDESNFVTGQIFALDKLQQGGALVGQTLQWNGSAWVPGGGVPAGSGSLWFSNTPPSGWAILDGSTLTGAQSLYPDLWANVDSTWKSGSNIILPNLKGKVPVGRDSADTDFDTMGETRGSKTHTLSTAELPAHNHPVTDPGHSHNITWGIGSGGAPTYPLSADDDPPGPSTRSNTTGITVGNTGGGNAHNIIQPSLVINFIIKL